MGIDSFAQYLHVSLLCDSWLLLNSRRSHPINARLLAREIINVLLSLVAKYKWLNESHSTKNSSCKKRLFTSKFLPGINSLTASGLTLVLAKNFLLCSWQKYRGENTSQGIVKWLLQNIVPACSHPVNLAVLHFCNRLSQVSIKLPPPLLPPFSFRPLPKFSSHLLLSPPLPPLPLPSPPLPSSSPKMAAAAYLHL